MTGFFSLASRRKPGPTSSRPASDERIRFSPGRYNQIKPATFPAVLTLPLPLRSGDEPGIDPLTTLVTARIHGPVGSWCHVSLARKRLTDWSGAQAGRSRSALAALPLKMTLGTIQWEAGGTFWRSQADPRANVAGGVFLAGSRGTRFEVERVRSRQPPTHAHCSWRCKSPWTRGGFGWAGTDASVQANSAASPAYSTRVGRVSFAGSACAGSRRYSGTRRCSRSSTRLSLAARASASSSSIDRARIA